MKNVKYKYLILISCIAVFIISLYFINAKVEKVEKTVKLIDINSSKITYEEVILLNGFDEKDKKELEKLKISTNEMPSGVYLKELGIIDENEVRNEAKVIIFDTEQIYTNNDDRKYTFNNWDEFINATKDDARLLDGRFYIVVLERGKVVELKEKLYL